MRTSIQFGVIPPKSELQVYAAFQGKDTPPGLEGAQKLPSWKNFQANKGESFLFTHESCQQVLLIGLGPQKSAEDFPLELAKREIGAVIKANKSCYRKVAIGLDSFCGPMEELLYQGVLCSHMAFYEVGKFQSSPKPVLLKEVVFFSKKKKLPRWEKILQKAQSVARSIDMVRDLVSSPPNILNSETYAKDIQADVKKNLPGVHLKILGKAELKKLGMGCFLAVNQGSAHGPRLIHLRYSPQKKAPYKRVSLVGKGVTFDVGGLSIKQSSAMVGMKFDMAGSATVYGAFRACALLRPHVEVSCILGITDNAVGPLSITPDSIVRASNGKTVEILNTDAEGRLILADVLHYACTQGHPKGQKPDALIDVATLTGACLTSLGHEVCAVLGNHQKLIDRLLDCAHKAQERMWPLPIFDEHRDDLKSPVADLRNIGNNPYGGTIKAGAFLENFVPEDVPWAHLDIAGVSVNQGHLPYCPPKGPSGLMVQTLLNVLESFAS